MTPEHLNERRLSPEQENKVKNILSAGSDAIIKELHDHQASGSEESVDAAFQRALEIMAKSIAEVAALKEFQVGKAPLTGRRLAFMPGYVKKDRNRVAFKVDNGAGEPIPSDIVHAINKEDDVPRVPGLLNQAKLFHALLHEHPDDDGFTNGGTHQFLVANERALKDLIGYQLDVLHISTVKDKRPKAGQSQSHGFRKLVLDFATTPTCAALADQLSSTLNADGLKPWPYNFQDVETDNHTVEIRQVRAHLVALWCKVLFDRSEKEQIAWIEDCAALAEKHRFAKLTDRIRQLPDAISKAPEEKFDHWYSIRLTSLPDFGTGRNEPFGSAMLLTNFELDTRWFYYIRSWINRVYHYFRAFENTISILKEIERNEFKGDFRPLWVPGTRMSKPGLSQGFSDSLGNYFDACANSPRWKELMVQSYAEAISALIDLSKVHALHFCSTTLGNSDPKCAAAMQAALRTFSRHTLKREYSVTCEMGVDGYPRFCDKLFGRLFAVGAHLCLGLPWGVIQQLLVKKGHVDLSVKDVLVGDSKWKALVYLTRNMFIPEMVPDETATHSQRFHSSEKIYESLSEYERQQLVLLSSKLNDELPSLNVYGTHAPERIKAAWNKQRPEALRIES